MNTMAHKTVTVGSLYRDNTRDKARVLKLTVPKDLTGPIIGKHSVDNNGYISVVMDVRQVVTLMETRPQYWKAMLDPMIDNCRTIREKLGVHRLDLFAGKSISDFKVANDQAVYYNRLTDQLLEVNYILGQIEDHEEFNVGAIVNGSAYHPKIHIHEDPEFIDARLRGNRLAGTYIEMNSGAYLPMYKGREYCLMYLREQQKLLGDALKTSALDDDGYYDLLSMTSLLTGKSPLSLSLDMIDLDYHARSLILQAEISMELDKHKDKPAMSLKEGWQDSIIKLVHSSIYK